MLRDRSAQGIWRLAGLCVLLCYPIMAIKWLPFGGGAVSECARSTRWPADAAANTAQRVARAPALGLAVFAAFFAIRAGLDLCSNLACVSTG